MKSLKENIHGAMDLGTVIMIGIVFASLMVIAYIIWEVEADLLPDGAPSGSTSAAYNSTYESIHNVTSGFDDAVNLLLVAITIVILAIAISALLMLRGR